MKTYECAIFDLDGTLYSSKGMDKSNQEAIFLAVAEWKAVTHEGAYLLVKDHLKTGLDESERPSIYKAALSIGVPDHIIKKHQLEQVSPENVLSHDQDLAFTLHKLSQRLKLALLTNTRTELALRALKQLGIAEGVFSIVKGGETLSTPKPNTEALLDIVDELSVKAKDTVMIGDRWAVDLQPAAAIGMAVVKINGRDEALGWVEKYLLATS